MGKKCRKNVVWPWPTILDSLALAIFIHSISLELYVIRQPANTPKEFSIFMHNFITIQNHIKYTGCWVQAVCFVENEWKTS